MGPKFKSLFSMDELQQLVSNTSAHLTVTRSIRHIAVTPSNLGNMKEELKRLLDELLYKYDANFGGFLLAYKNVNVTADKGSVDDYSTVHFDIEADFYIFLPKVGDVLYGLVTKKTSNHLSCLVHRFFQVSIPCDKEDTDIKKQLKEIKIGDNVKFELKVCDITGIIPFVEGSLLSVSHDDNQDEPKEKKKKKKKKLEKSDVEKPETVDGSFLPNINIEETMNQKKRKREIDEVDDDKTKKKKKKKRNQSESDKDKSSQDPEYSNVIEHLKESYLNETTEQSKSEEKEKDKKVTKRKLLKVSDDTVEFEPDNSNITDEVDTSEETRSKKKKKQKEKITRIEDKSSVEGKSAKLDIDSVLERYKTENKILADTLKASRSKDTSNIAEEEDNTKKSEEPIKKKKKKKDKDTSNIAEVKEEDNTTNSEEPVKKKKKKKDKDTSNIAEVKEDNTTNSEEPMKKKKKKKDKDTSNIAKEEEEDNTKNSKEPMKKKKKKNDKDTSNIAEEEDNKKSEEPMKKKKGKDKLDKLEHHKKHKKNETKETDLSSLLQASDKSESETFDSLIKDKQPVSILSKKNMLDVERLRREMSVESMLTPNVVPDEEPVTTAGGSGKKKPIKNTTEAAILSRISSVYSDDSDKEKSEKISENDKPHFPINHEMSPYVRLAESMANSVDRKRKKFDKSVSDMPRRKSLPIIFPTKNVVSHKNTLREEHDAFDELLDPLSQSQFDSDIKKKRKSVTINEGVMVSTPANHVMSESSSDDPDDPPIPSKMFKLNVSGLESPSKKTKKDKIESVDNTENSNKITSPELENILQTSPRKAKKQKSTSPDKIQNFSGSKTALNISGPESPSKKTKKDKIESVDNTENSNKITNPEMENILQTSPRKAKKQKSKSLDKIAQNMSQDSVIEKNDSHTEGFSMSESMVLPDLSDVMKILSSPVNKTSEKNTSVLPWTHIDQAINALLPTTKSPEKSILNQTDKSSFSDTSDQPSSSQSKSLKSLESKESNKQDIKKKDKAKKKHKEKKDKRDSSSSKSKKKEKKQSLGELKEKLLTSLLKQNC